MPKLYKLTFHFLLTSSLIFIITNLTHAQTPKIVKLAAQGDASPIGGEFGYFTVFDFNIKEDLIFNGTIPSIKSAIFLNSGHSTVSVIADSQTIEGFGEVTRVGTASINNDASIAFEGQVMINNSIRNNLFLKDAGGISKIASHGDAVPGGSMESPTLRSFSLNNNGAVAFAAFIVPEPFRQAIFVKTGSGISPVVITGDPTPIGGTFRFAFLQFLDFNDAGTVLFSDQIDLPDDSTSEGIFTSSGGSISKIVTRGDPTSDNKEFTYLSSGAMNNPGDVVFIASIGIDYEVEYDGLFLSSGGGISMIARTGASAPGGGTFSGFSLPSINDQKQILFQASIDGGTAASGLFIASGGSIQKITAAGESTPVGGSYSGFLNHILTEQSSVAFSAYLTGGNSSSGIFLWNGAPRVEVSRDTVEFNDVIPGQTAKLDMEITNSGGKALEVKEISIAPVPPYGLENVPELPLILQPGEKSQFLVTYASPGKNNSVDKISNVMQEGSLTITTNAPHPVANIPVVPQKDTTLKVDIIPSEGPEVKAGQFASIEIKVVDAIGQKIDFDGGVTIKLLTDQTTPGITRLPEFQSVSVSDGAAQSVFFFTPKEQFATDKPIDANTVLSGRAVIEVQLENSSIPAVTKEINVRSPLDFFVDRIEVQQGILNTHKEVFQEYLPGTARTFPALPFIAEHNTTVQVFVGFNNTTATPFSKIELPGISSELKISVNENHLLTIPNMKSGGNSTREFIVKDEYSSNEQELLRDALFEYFASDKLKDQGQYKFNAELKFVKLEEAEADKENNVKSFTASFVETKPLRILTFVGTRSGQAPGKVEPGIWDLLKDIYPIQNSKFTANDPNSRIYHFQGGSLFSDVGLSTLRQILDRYNKENPGDQRDLLLMFAPLDVCQEACSNSHSGGCAESVGGKVGIITHADLHGVAHELAHMLGLRDTYKTDKYSTNDGEPNPRRSNAVNSGNPVETGNINLANREKTTQESTHYELMGTGTWVDRVSWDHLYQTKFKPAAAEEIQKQELEDNFIAVSGIIDTNGTVTFNPFITLSQVPDISESKLGIYSIEFQDNSGSLLSAHSFNVEFNLPDAGDQPEVPFSFYLPLPQGTAQMVMKKNHINIADRTFSANPPSVQLNSPVSGETIKGIKTIQWTADDTDEDELTYNLLYSPDGEEQYVIAVNLDDTSYEWNSSVFPASGSASITVIANDGINETRSAASNLIIDSPVSSNEDEVEVREYNLSQNFPNPFNPSTKIAYSVAEKNLVTLKVFDVLGREIETLVDEEKTPGKYEIEFNASALSAGIYFYKIESGAYVKTMKMIFLK